jgi:hypothetical protein
MTMKVCKEVTPGFTTYRLGDVMVGSLRITSDGSFCATHAPTGDKRYFSKESLAFDWLNKKARRF